MTVEVVIDVLGSMSRSEDGTLVEQARPNSGALQL